MKVFSVSQIRAADAYTIEHEPISSIDLMERAARSCYHWFHEFIPRDYGITILCGMGNNGGDGLALTRMLKATGYQVQVIIIKHSEKGSPDFKTNLDRLKQWDIHPIELKSVSDLNDRHADVWVDSILGSGLNAPLRGMILECIQVVNSKSGLKVAIDIPTGLFADGNANNDAESIFIAHDTLSFQFPKRSFLFSEFGSKAGDFDVLDIGLSNEFIDQEPTDEYYLTEDWIADLLPNRSKFAHKGTFGHALLISGGLGKVGAAILATRAALRSGAGLVSAYIPFCGLNPMQAANPEVMVQLDQGEDKIEKISFDFVPSSIGIGPGLGTNTITSKAVLDFIQSQNQPIVIDADGLNIMSTHGDWSIVPKNSIVTPHLGELDRMLGQTYRGEDVYDPAREFATKNQINLIVKGAHCALYAADGNVYYNSTGNNGMATAGSGDVLTGIITGLLAQGFPPKEAAMVGMYHHGLAGDLAASFIGERSVTAGDIIDYLDID